MQQRGSGEIGCGIKGEGAGYTDHPAGGFSEGDSGKRLSEAEAGYSDRSVYSQTDCRRTQAAGDVCH